MSDKSLRLQVVFSTIDKLTAPLKKLTGKSSSLGKALKATHDRLKELNVQQKQIAHFRELHTGLTNTSTKLREAEQHVSQLSQRMQQTIQPTRAMTREFNAAVKAASVLKQTRQQQSAQLQTLRSQLFNSGINTNQLSLRERQLRNNIAATDVRLAEQQKRLSILHNQQQKMTAARGRANHARRIAGQMSGAGISASIAGGMMGIPLVKGIQEAKHYQTEMGRIHALRLGSDVATQAAAFAKSNPSYGNSQLDNLTLLRDGITAFADLHHAKMVMPILAKMKFSNHAFYGEEVGSENERKFMDMLKVIELRGGLTSQASFATQANTVQRVITATGNRVGPEEWLNLIKTGGIAAKGLDDEAFYYQLEPLVQVIGGHRVGTALMSGYQNLYQGRTTIAVKNRLKELGLIADNSKVIDDKAGQFSFLNKGALLGAELFRTNQFAWMETVLLPQLAKKGITSDKAILDSIGSIFSNRTASGLFAQMYLERSQIHKNTRLNRDSSDIDQLNTLGRATLSGKELEFKAKLADLNLALGETILPLVSSALETGTVALKEFNTFMANNPALAKVMLVSLSLIAGVLVILGPLMLGLAALIGPYAMLHVLFAKMGIAGGVLTPILHGIGSAFTWLSSTLLLVGRALLLNPIGIAITAIATAAFLIYKYWDPIKQFFSELWGKVKQTFMDVVNWFNSLTNQFTNIGAQLMHGLVNGIIGAMGWVKSTITQTGANVINWFKDKLGIRSPSRVFAELGEQTMQGLAIGLQRSEHNPVAQVSRLAKRLTQIGTSVMIGAALPSMALSQPLTTGTFGGNTVQGDTIQITINTSSGSDEHAIANAVQRILEDRDRQKSARTRSSYAIY